MVLNTTAPAFGWCGSARRRARCCSPSTPSGNVRGGRERPCTEADGDVLAREPEPGGERGRRGGVDGRPTEIDGRVLQPGPLLLRVAPLLVDDPCNALLWPAAPLLHRTLDGVLVWRRGVTIQLTRTRRSHGKCSALALRPAAATFARSAAVAHVGELDRRFVQHQTGQCRVVIQRPLDRRNAPHQWWCDTCRRLCSAPASGDTVRRLIQDVREQVHSPALSDVEFVQPAHELDRPLLRLVDQIT